MTMVSVRLGLSPLERTEAAASGLGLASIAEEFRALTDIYGVPYGFFDVTSEVGGSMEYFILGETAASIAQTLALDPATLTEIATEDGALAETIRNYGALVLFHETYLKTGLAQSIGLTTGFTSVDGD